MRRGKGGAIVHVIGNQGQKVFFFFFFFYSVGNRYIHNDDLRQEGADKSGIWVRVNATWENIVAQQSIAFGACRLYIA